MEADLVLGAVGLLGVFNRAGVLAPVDVHVATRLCSLASIEDDLVSLGVAFAVRGPRFGHVYADLGSVQDTVAGEDIEVDLSTLPWPDPEEWRTRLAGSDLVAVGEGDDDRPLRLLGNALYLDRYWRDERAVAADLESRASFTPGPVDAAWFTEAVERLLPGSDSEEQRWAAATAIARGVTVIAGGPGTGKTTTIARVLALLEEAALAAGGRLPLIALAAPTGKAAARIGEAVRAEAQRMQVCDEVRRRLLATSASTLHRLLGVRPDSSTRFRYHRLHRLPHDVVIVDETSMVALSLMARLLEAVRSDARLVLVGDPEQLASVEAGAVLGDIVGPARTGTAVSGTGRERLVALTGTAPPEDQSTTGLLVDAIVVLRANRRFGGVLAELASVVRAGDADGVMRILRCEDPSLRWLEVDTSEGDGSNPLVGTLRESVVAAGGSLGSAALEGDPAMALRELGRFRLLCAHRRGSAGVATWTSIVESWLAREISAYSLGDTWYPGRPVMITANDYSIGLYNGDTGVAISRGDGSIGVAFVRGGSIVDISPARLSGVESVFAMTVHKAQGSEFDEVAVVLPPPASAVLTRELLYTAVTRARASLILAGTEETIRAAVARPVARASGLTDRLWGDATAGAAKTTGR